MKVIFKYLLWGVLSLALATKAFSEEAATKIQGPLVKSINLGIVVKNKNYQIYRSSELGNDGYKTLTKYLGENHLPSPKTVIYMNYYGYKFPFYFANQEFEMSQNSLFTFHHSFGPTRTYLDGYNPYFPTDDIDEGNHLGNKAQKLFELRNDGVDGGVNNFLKILKMVVDPANQPILFHCFGGKHRTGMIAMAIRYMQGGNGVDGPTVNIKGIDLTPAQYEYYLFNKNMFRSENIDFIEALKNDVRFLDLKEKYGASLRDENLNLIPTEEF